jgi:hypothetical protein
LLHERRAGNAGIDDGLLEGYQRELDRVAQTVVTSIARGRTHRFGSVGRGGAATARATPSSGAYISSRYRMGTTRWVKSSARHGEPFRNGSFCECEGRSRRAISCASVVRAAIRRSAVAALTSSLESAPRQMRSAGCHQCYLASLLGGVAVPLGDARPGLRSR